MAIIAACFQFVVQLAHQFRSFYINRVLLFINRKLWVVGNKAKISDVVDELV